MQPFQQWFVELVSMIDSTLLAVAACAGILGIWKWRDELVGKARFQLSRRLIFLALRFRDEFDSTRSPITFPGEWADRKGAEGESEKVSFVLDEAFARQKRLGYLRETIRKMHESGWEAETILGDDTARLIKPFEDAYRDLDIAFNAYFAEQHNLAQGMPIDLAFNRSMRDKVYGVGTDNLSKCVDQAVAALKTELRQYIPQKRNKPFRAYIGIPAVRQLFNIGDMNKGKP